MRVIVYITIMIKVQRDRHASHLLILSFSILRRSAFTIMKNREALVNRKSTQKSRARIRNLTTTILTTMGEWRSSSSVCINPKPNAYIRIVAMKSTTLNVIMIFFRRVVFFTSLSHSYGVSPSSLYLTISISNVKKYRVKFIS